MRVLPSLSAWFITVIVGVGVAGCGGGGGGGFGPSPASAPGSGPGPGSGSGTATPGGAPAPAHPLMAGVAVVDITPPVGVPLGGFGEGDRRLSFPDLNPFDYHTLFRPSVGIRDPILAKCLVLDDGVDRVAILTLDLIACEGAAVDEAYAKAQAMGLATAKDAVLACASHTHSGPGTITSRMFWQLAAMDLYQSQVRDGVTSGIARALVEAERALAPARLGSGLTNLRGISKNRRTGVSPVFTRDSIDDELGVVRVDRPDGTPLATVYNYAIHGLAYWADNHRYTADLMGDASRFIEANGGGVGLFANGAEGDIAPDRGLGSTDPQRSQVLGERLGQAVMALRPQIQTTDDVDVASASETVDFGAPFVFVTTQTIASGLGQASFLSVINNLGGIGATIQLPGGWQDREFRFQALRLNDTVIASIPGEAIHTLGLQIKQEGRNIGFGLALVFGLANGHMAYITTETEYRAGGYEGIATLYGPRTGENVKDAAVRVMQRVR